MRKGSKTEDSDPWSKTQKVKETLLLLYIDGQLISAMSNQPNNQAKRESPTDALYSISTRCSGCSH